jgi:hypothetical protein
LGTESSLAIDTHSFKEMGFTRPLLPLPSLRFLHSSSPKQFQGQTKTESNSFSHGQRLRAIAQRMPSLTRFATATPRTTAGQRRKRKTAFNAQKYSHNRRRKIVDCQFRLAGVNHTHRNADCLALLQTNLAFKKFATREEPSL